MSKELITKEWVFPTLAVPTDRLPAPDNFRGSLPENISLADIARVQREASETYEIVKFKGVSYEHIVFNPGGDPDKTIGFTPTSFSGARKNPGNMFEKTLDAIASPNTRIDYLTPPFNYPSGPMRPKDYKYFLEKSRLTKGTGEDADPLRPLDSMLDIVDLYEKMGWVFPRYFSADSEGGRQALGRAAAFGTSMGMHLNGMPGLVDIKGYGRMNVYADLANRLTRLGGSVISLEVNGATQKMTKKNMPEVYPWNKYYAHQFPIPGIMHPVDFARAIRMSRAYSRHDNPNKIPDHAVYFDLLAMMALNDAPVTLTYGSDNPLGESNEIKTFIDGFIHDFPNDFKSQNRVITLRMIQNAGVDYHTGDPTARIALDKRTFGLGAMLSIVRPENDALTAQLGPTGTDG